jgi:exodeoxyribonuclease V alpha subunit
VCADEFNRGVGATVRSARLPRAENACWTEALTADDTENGCFWYAVPSDPPSAKVDAPVKEWARTFGLLDGGALAAAAKAVTADAAVFDGRSSDGARALFRLLDQSRILAVVRKGSFGVDHINELLLKERLGRVPSEPFVAGGIPVMITRNVPSMNLFNGDVGVTVKRPEGGVSVLFPRGERVVSCPVALLPDHELAYAMTVHKSQGSEFENVMMILPDDGDHPLLNRQVVYTGITRAKKRAVIVGSAAALNEALSRKIERDTGLCLRRGSYAAE